MHPPVERPEPGSHDRSTPTGTLEESAANLFEAMLAAREAEERGEHNSAALRDFYATKTGFKPENFTPPRLREEG